jgi:alkaline phosphatase D
VKRREFLTTSVVLAGSPWLGCSSESDSGADAQLPFDGDLFPQSVASGDPRADRVVLWTRVGGAGAPAKRTVQLEVATDPRFAQRLRLEGGKTGESPRLALVAERSWDYCVRVRVDGLQPGTDYYYRFLTERDGQLFRSRTGRTRTAPQGGADVPVRFLTMSCQDYGARHYLALQRAAELDADFVVHLGDYVYETSGDPDFQSSDGDRQVRFGDRAGALELSAGLDDDGPTFLAARSLDNYRDLYRTARSDRELQRLHERFAIIPIPDDHEFSDDAWGQNATYLSGRSSELDPERRTNADQAWFEYMPIDYEARDFAFDRDAPFPENLKIYRDFTFGKHVHLLMTDLRRFRADHVIAEDAHPARIAVEQARLLQLLPELPQTAEPYLDFTTAPQQALREALRAGVLQGFEPDAELIQVAELDGAHTAQGVNDLVASYNQWTTGEPLEPVALDDPALNRGVSYGLVGKLSRYTSFGSRYFVNPEAFGIVAEVRYQDSNGASEQVMGEEQEQWFIATLQNSVSSWKLWGNPYTLSARDVDLSALVLPDARLTRRFSLSADDWSGFPNRRAQLLDAIADVEDVVVVTGDSHSFFASGLGLPNGGKVVEFVCGAVSSTTYRAALESGAGGMAGVAALAPIAGRLIQRDNPEVAFQNVEDNGFALVVATEAALQVTFYQIPHARLSEPFTASADSGSLAELFTETTFSVRRGKGRIERSAEGEEGQVESWDPATQRWS